jgi:RNA polymerase sigma-70 factor (ECF subfamily)
LIHEMALERPHARVDAREAISLAFVAALQRLPPRRRAVLLLRDVLGYRASEVAEMLGTSEAAVNSLLRRARASLEEQGPPAVEPARLPPAAERELAGCFADAFCAGDVDGVLALLTRDARLTLPPGPFDCRGREEIARFLAAAFAARAAGAWRLVATGANGQPAFVLYVRDTRTGAGLPRGLLVLTVEPEGVSALTGFRDTGFLRHFRLPPTLRW